MIRIASRPTLVLLLLAMTACATPRATNPPPASGVPVLRPCPDWSRASAEDFSNRTTSNFGCADAVNFHAQLADPGDAVRGRVNGPGDAGSAARAVERLRLAPPAPGGASPSAPVTKAEPRP